MRAVRVEIDAGNFAVAAGSVLVTLKEEVGAVVIVGIGAFLVFENEISVLVGLGFCSLDFVRR